jgi:RND family efflux transporter MFP subunit
MRRLIIAVAIIAAVGVGAGAYLMRRDAAPEAQAGEGVPGGGRGGAGGGGFAGPGGFGPGGFGGRGGPRLPMTVELAAVKRADLSQRITVVGNLIGLQTVAAAPKISGRLDAVQVRMGDRVSRGQPLAKIEDSELREQVKQAEASFAVSAATIRQREADLRFAQTNLDRSRNLFERQLIPKQTLDDAEARYQAAVAQLDLARAQNTQSQARLDELKINLSNTVVTSPVNGFVGSRSLDPGAWVTPNSAFISVVDISTVRIVSNVVERDLRRISEGLPAEVEVDAYPGEKFQGSVAHVAPVLDPNTRTAQIEVEIRNADGRLKPGMYARVHFTVDQRDKALVVPATALVAVGGRQGVFLPAEGDVAEFRPIVPGLSTQELVEISSGLAEGEQIVTTGAAALREGDRIVIAGQAEGGRGSGSATGARAGGGRGGQRGRAPAGAVQDAPSTGEGAPVRQPGGGGGSAAGG